MALKKVEERMTLKELANKIYKGKDIYAEDMILIESTQCGEDKTEETDILGRDYADEYLETHGHKEVIAYRYDKEDRLLTVEIKG